MLGTLVAISASFDIDLKQSSRILATATLSTSRKLDPATSSCRAARASRANSHPWRLARRIFTCNTPADSGPDSGANNNCRWEISAPSWTRATADIDTPPIAEDGVQFDTLTSRRNRLLLAMGGADGPVDDPAFALPSYLGADESPDTGRLHQERLDLRAGGGIDRVR